MNKLIQQFQSRLQDAGNGNPRRTAEELAAHALACRPLEIYFKAPSAEQLAELERLVERAVSGEPIQYVIGQVDFRDLQLICDSRALIPRGETELLVDEVLARLAAGPADVVDVCTGTGCIGLAVADEAPDATVLGIDISPEALSLATENATRTGLSERYTCIKNDLLSGYDADQFDVVVSNPPYILADVCLELDASVRDYEPMLALDGGKDGMDLIRPLTLQAAHVLRAGGSYLLEIGYDQGQAVAECMRAAGFSDVRIIQDYAGLDRIVAGLWA